MKRKKIVLWFSMYMAITLSLIATVTLIDKADDNRQMAQAGGAAEHPAVSETLMEKEDPAKEKLDKTGHNEENTQVDADIREQKKEEETLDVEAETVIASDGVSIRANYGARIYADVDKSKPMVALTFDDGPNEKSTNVILDALEKYQARATFFVVGYKVEDNSDTIKRAYRLGCEIGSHTYNHIELTTLSRKQIKAQIRNTEKVIRAVTGQKRVLLRPPYGSVDENVLKEITSPIVLWSIDTEDWKTRDSKKTVDSVINNVKDGDVILLHDSYDESAEAAEEIIRKLSEKGYQMVTASELGYYKLGGLATGVKYGAITGD